MSGGRWEGAEELETEMRCQSRSDLNRWNLSAMVLSGAWLRTVIGEMQVIPYLCPNRGFAINV